MPNYAKADTTPAAYAYEQKGEKANAEADYTRARELGYRP